MLLLLEGRGLVARKRHPTDGRARSVSLTEKGRRVWQRLRSVSEPFLARLASAYEIGELQVLLQLLSRIPNVMATDHDRPTLRQI